MAIFFSVFCFLLFFILVFLLCNFAHFPCHLAVWSHRFSHRPLVVLCLFPAAAATTIVTDSGAFNTPPVSNALPAGADMNDPAVATQTNNVALSLESIFFFFAPLLPPPVGQVLL